MNSRAPVFDLVRWGILVAVVGFGGVGGLKSLERGAFHVAGPDAGTDATGDLLLNIPDAAHQLRERLRTVPQNRPLMVYAPVGGWMADDLTRMAACLLTPRPVFRFGKGAAGQTPGAILIYRASPPAGVHVDPLGDYASLAVLHSP